MFTTNSGAIKKSYNDEIERSVNAGNNLYFTKKLLEAKFEKKLSEYECIRLEEKFVQYLVDCWLKQAPQQLVNSIQSRNILKFHERLHSLNTYNDCYQLAFGFVTVERTCGLPTILHSYFFELKELSNSSLKVQSQEKQNVNKFICHCTKLLQDKESLRDEVLFNTNLLKLLKENPKELYQLQRESFPKIQDLGNVLNFKVMLQHIILRKSSNEDFIRVQDSAKLIIHKDDFIYNKKIGEIISSYFQPATVKENIVDRSVILEVVGKHIVISKVLEEIEFKLLQKRNIEEVRFVNAYVIDIDRDLSAKTWHGKNIVVYAETAIVSDDRIITWDVSGEDAAPTNNCEVGAGADGCGLPGTDGQTGESGGNVLIMVNELINAHNFRITSNGGNGSNGQDGGKGKDGKDGYFLEETAFKTLFPPVSKFSSSNKTDNLITTMNNVLEDFQSLDDLYIGSLNLDKSTSKEDFEKCIFQQVQHLKNFYFKVRCNNGSKVTFSFHCEGFFTICQSFLLHEGSLGEEGRPGGLGGKQGMEGYAGDINIQVKDTLNTNVTILQVSGKEGIPGKFGMRGSPGKKGADRGYEDQSITFPSIWPKFFIPNKNVTLKVDYFSKTNSQRVFTPHNNMYAEIVEKQHDCVRSDNYTHRVRLNHQRTMVDKHVQRKKTISEKSIMEQYSQQFHKYDSLTFDNLLEKFEIMFNDETLQSQDITTETKVSRRINYTDQQTMGNNSNSITDYFFNYTLDTCPLQETPDVSLTELPAEELIKLVKDDPSNGHSWHQLLYIRLDLTQLCELWNVASTLLNELPPNDKFNELLETGFINKFQLALLAHYGGTFENLNGDDRALKSYSTHVKLNEMSLKMFDKIFTESKSEPRECSLEDYFLKDCQEKRESIFKQFTLFLENPFDKSETYNAIFMNEFTSNSNKLLLELKMFVDSKNLHIATKLEHLKNALHRDQHQIVYNDLLKGVVEKDIQSLVAFQYKISHNQFLNVLYKSFVKISQERYLWNDVINQKSDEIFSYFQHSFQDMGPLSALYREYLAYHFETNILVYSMNEMNEILLLHNHNPRATSSVCFLLKENKFSHLNVNNDFIEMLNDHFNKSALYSDTLMYIDTLNDIDDFVSNHPSTVDLFKEFCSDQSVRIRVKLIYIYMEDANIRKILEAFRIDKEKDLLSCRLEKLKLEFTGCSNILYFIALHFENNTTHISAKELSFVINFILTCTLNVPHVIPIVSWILAAYPQRQWLVEIILLKLELNYSKTLDPNLKTKWRKYLCGQNVKTVLMLLMEKICGDNFNVNEKNFEETIFLLNNIPQAHMGLDQVELEEWKYYLKDKFWANKLKSIGKWTNDNLQSATYYLVVLENLLGSEICYKLIKTLKICESELLTSSTKTAEVPNIFRTITNKEVYLDDSLVRILETCVVSDWIQVIKDNCYSTGKERTLTDLMKIIRNFGNTSEEVLNMLDSLERSVECSSNIIKTLRFIAESKLTKFINQLIGNYRDSKVTFLDKLKSNIKHIIITDKTFERLGKALMQIYFPHKYNNKNDESNRIKDVEFLTQNQMLETLIATVIVAVEMKHKITLRDAQKLAVMTILKSEGKILCQVATGEGKSLIVVIVAIIKVLAGEKVDIITSSRVLAERDAKLNKDIFSLFGINVRHNCSESIEERRQVYSNNSVVYGELANFQRDFLLDHVYNKNILGDRSFQTIIVDEVDSMLLDKGNNTLYLSHEIPGLDKLDSLFIFIWKALHIPADSEQLDFNLIVLALKNKILHDLFGIVTKEDLCCLDTKSTDSDVNNTWHYLIEQKIIDISGKIINENIEDDLKDLPKNPIHKNHLKYLFKKVNERVKAVVVPNYLKSFVEEHLEEWIINGLRAMTMEPGVDYVVDFDRSDSNRECSPNIMIVDRDTGSDLLNSQWENGLHQFLQIKHGCKLSLISFKAVFISNVSFLKKYTSLYGLTGTLGTTIERDLLKDIYKVDYVTIPTAKTKFFTEEVPIVCSSAEEWLHTICREVCKKTEHRSVLVVCETVNDVMSLKIKFDLLKGKLPYKKIHTYTRDYEKLAVTEELEPGHVIISTNLAGRGTDIKLTRGLIDAGGLHVCLTYLPGNSRVEEQAFGRAARNGEPGSGQMIINSYTNNIVLKIMYLKQQRDNNERLRITDIKNYHKSHIQQEETCFENFLEVFKSIDKSKHPEEVRTILRQTSLDQWAYWLEENSNCLKVENVKDSLKNISNMITETDSASWSTNVKDPFQLSKLGLFLINNKRWEESISLFNTVIENEPSFSEGAYYYRLMAKSNIENITPKVILEDLKLVSTQIKDRMENLSINAYTIDYLKKINTKSILQIEAFKEQQLNMAEIYNVFLQSIYEVVGIEIDYKEFILPTVMDEEIASRFFSDLVNKEVINKPYFEDNISKQDFSFSVKYGISPNEMKKIFEELQGTIVDEAQILKKLECLILPSRELFWSQLSSKEILLNEKQFCIVDLEKLQHVDPSFITIITNLHETIIENENDIWMYKQDEIGCSHNNSILVTQKVLKERIGEHTFEFFLNKSIIYLNTLATIKESGGNVQFGYFDCLKREDFLKVGISDNTDANIIHELEKMLIIKKKEGAKGYMMIGNYYDLENIELSISKAYSDDVIKLLNVCFAFRIAWQKICMHRENKKQNSDILYLPLPIRPHKNIIENLYEYGILLKHTINSEKNISKILENLYPNAMNKEDYVKLFSDLYDKKMCTDIVQSLISHKWIEKQKIKNILTNKYVIVPGNQKTLDPTMEYKVDTIKLVLRNHLYLIENREKIIKHVEPIIKNHEGVLHRYETPTFSLQPLSETLKQTNLPVSNSAIFSLNGFDQILVLEEKKFTMKMMIGTTCLALSGVSQIAVGTYMQLVLLCPNGAALIGEGISDLVFAVKSCFTGQFSWREFTINKILSLIISSAFCILNPFQKFKSMFGINLSGPSAMSSETSECTSIIGKASRFVNNIFKRSPTESVVNRTVVVKTIAKQVLAQSALGCSLGITYATIDKHLIPELDNLGEKLVEHSSSTIDDIITDNENMLQYIKEMYILLGAKDAKSIILLCYSNVLDSFKKGNRREWETLCVNFCNIVDREFLNCFQDCKNKGEISLNNACTLLISLANIIRKLKTFATSGSYMISGRAVSKIVKSLEGKFKCKLDELRKSSFKERCKKQVGDIEIETFVTGIFDLLKKEIKSILSENIRTNITIPLLSLFKSKCGEIISNYASEKCLSLFHEEEISELTKYNEELFKTTDFGRTIKQEDFVRFHYKEYNDYLIELLKRKRSVPAFIELLKNNYSVNEYFAELCCSVIPLALRHVGFNVPILSLVVYKNGVQKVYGGSSVAECDKLTVTIDLDNFANNLMQNKISIRYLFDTIYRTIVQSQPEFKGLTTEILHTMIIKAIENDFYIKNFIQDHCSNKAISDDKNSGNINQNIHSKSTGNIQMDTSSSCLWSNLDSICTTRPQKKVKFLLNNNDIKLNVVELFKAALGKINAHLHKTQSYLKNFNLTLEDFVETKHVIIPSNGIIPGRFFDSYATAYELVIPIFTQPDSEKYTDFILKMTLNTGSKKNQQIDYSFEPDDSKQWNNCRHLDKGMRGSIFLDGELGDNVYSVKDCHRAGELILPGYIPHNQCTSSQKESIEYMILGDSIFEFMAEYISMSKCLIKAFSDKSPRELKSEICTLAKLNNNTKCVVLYFGNYVIRSKLDIEKCVEELKELVTSLRLHIKKIKIILCEILYKKVNHKGNNKRNEKVKRLNESIAKYCTGENITFFKTNSYVTEENLRKDGWHLNRKGYHNLSKTITKTIQSQIKE